MADQWPEPRYTDGDLTVAMPCSLPVFSSPIRATTTGYVLTQQFMQFLKYFTPTPLSTPHPSAGMLPDYALQGFLLVAEGQRQDMGGGLVKWERTYAKVPSPHDEYESYAYPFIGYAGEASVGTLNTDVEVLGRAREAAIVNSRVRHEYFLTGPRSAYKTPGNIPQLRALKYYAGLPTNAVVVSGQPTTDFLNDAYPDEETTLLEASSPSRSTYIQWMANAESLSWNSGCISQDEATWTSATNPFNEAALSGQLIVEDSRLTRWQGNIYERAVRYVLAQ
jgi:hypothetical protein